MAIPNFADDLCMLPSIAPEYFSVSDFDSISKREDVRRPAQLMIAYAGCDV